ncbi:MAG TPA: hypothetical protein VG387_05675 [Rhizomicrobium sp.]|jgi:hypothetical protein|nr:hypothetical protein [Rhizomicrobium sp.]
MSARTATIASTITLCLALCACASSGGGGDHVSITADGMLTRGGASRGDVGFVYADKDCIPFAIDGNQSLDLLGDPQRVVQTNDYIGTMIYAVPAGAHTLTVRSWINADGQGHEAFPTAPLTVRPRHFYGIDCAHHDGQASVMVSDHDHVGRRSD